MMVPETDVGVDKPFSFGTQQEQSEGFGGNGFGELNEGVRQRESCLC